MCRPAAVAWFVTFVVVNAVNGVFWAWSRAHSSKKRCEIIAPFGTYGYAPPAICGVSGIIGITTSANDGFPYFVFCRVFQAMPEISGDYLLSGVAAARHNSPA